ncbi:hypothetical protein GCM10010271_13590 [Streptomyces kurssanovii]|nr:hypothetical protein GCM10010271_13590 [Streptomyces kurssanovii]
MRKTIATVAALGLAALGATVPASSAGAATTASGYCDYLWNGKDNNGNPLATWNYFYAYKNTNCDGYLGRSAGEDSNWGNDQGAFQGGDTNQAGSLLLKTTDSGLAVKVFNGTGTDWGGGYNCIRGNEFYISSLHDGEAFTSGALVRDEISSHRRVAAADCNGNFMH